MNGRDFVGKGLWKPMEVAGKGRISKQEGQLMSYNVIHMSYICHTINNLVGPRHRSIRKDISQTLGHGLQAPYCG